MSLLVDRIAEQRIQAALDEGQLSDLPGKGEPLSWDDDSMVPPELRMRLKGLDTRFLYRYLNNRTSNQT
ncbi:DUF1992 domain-containing protein [Vibrio fluvialis]|nr:DUF1992 domain-containing protein [Vibrio fluvialis]